jgi:ribose transport system substrate-binding protein
MIGSRARRRLLALLLMALLAVVVTACGSSDSSTESTGGGATTAAEGEGTEAADVSEEEEAGGGSAGVEAAEKEVEELRAETTEFTPPGPEFDASAAQGGTVWYIPVSAEIPVLAIESKGMEEAAQAAGMSYKSCDGKFTPAAQSACITQAVNSKAAGVITDSVDPKTVGPALSAAASAEIPVVGFNSIGEETDLYRTVNSGDPQSQIGAMNWIVANSGGEANVLGVYFVGDSQTEAGAEAGIEALEKNCPECSYESATVTSEQINSIPSAVSSALLKNPDVNYGIPQFDFFAPLFERGVQTAGKTNDIQTVSTNAALSQMKVVASGGMQKADVGANRNYVGWEAVDALLRMIAGEPAATELTYPVRVFDETNVGELDLSEEAAADGSWFGPTIYKQEFPKLWGLG